jgi:hypothetical protein
MWVESDVRNAGAPPAGAVRVIGDSLMVAGLPRHLPGSWAVGPASAVAAVGPEDLVLLVFPTAAEVAAAHQILGGGARLVVLIEANATAERVAEVLEAGADTCVRAGSTAVLAGHLVACRRRTVTREPMTPRMRNTRPVRPLNPIRAR